MSDTKKRTLRQYVFGNFFRAALIPLLFIELTLVLLYFLINAYNHENSSVTLQDESISHLREIVVNQSQIISRDFASVRELSAILQKETEYFYDNPKVVPSSSQHPAQYGFAPNGVYYRTNKSDGAASLYYSTVTEIGPAEKEKAARSEVLDHVYKNIVESNSSIVAVYLNTHDSMNRYYPFIDEVYNQYLPDMNIPEFNFYYLADRKNNPEGGPVWTDTYLDPAGQGWMMSCIVPIYNGDFLEGVVGIDITVDRLLNNILNLKLPWDAEAFLVDKNGTIMAMPPGVEKLLGLTELRKHVYAERVAQDTFKPEEFNLQKSSWPELITITKHILESDSSVNALPLGDKNYYLAQATVDETGWKLMVVADRDRILQPITMMNRKATRIGYLAVGCMIAFYFIFFLYLLHNAARIARKISIPVVDIAEKSSHIAQGLYETVLSESKIAELDTLSSSYSAMVDEIRTLYENLREKIETASIEIAERKQAQEALLQRERELLEAKNMAEAASRAKSNFLANMRHELFTPMNHIIGFTDMVLSEEFGVLDERNKRYLTIVQNSSNHLLTLLTDVLELAKIEVGEMTLQHEGIDILKIVESCAAMIQEKAAGKGIQVKIRAESPGLVFADEQKIKNVVYCLLENGVKFTTEKRDIQVLVDQVEGDDLVARLGRSAGEKRYLRLSVTNFGIGIHPQDLERIFNAFEQIESEANRRFAGTGKGLFVAKKLIELHGGCIWAESEGPETAATFRFVLPLDSGAAA